MRRSPRVFCVGVLALLAACHSLRAESITSYPSSAYVMLKVNNLEKTSGKIGKLCEQWGIAALQSQTADPLGSLMKLANIQQGMQKDGELGVAVMPGAAQPDVLVMIPVSDYKMFLTNFPQAKAEGAIHSFTLPQNGMQAFVTQAGGYALLSMNREVLEQAPPRSPFSAATAKEMAGRDIAIYVNFPSFRDNALGGIGMVKGMVQAQMTQKATAAGGDSKTLAPVVGAAIGQYIGGVSRFITDTRALTYGISLSEAGIQTTCLAEFEPQSYLANFAAALKPTAAPLITGLPEGKYLMVGGLAFDTPAYAKLIDDAAAPIVAAAQTAGPKGQSIVDLVTAMKSFTGTVKQYSMAASGNEAKAGEAPLMSVIGVIHGDAKALQTSQRQLAKSQGGLVELMQAAQGGGVNLQCELKPDARTLGGVTFDEFTQTLKITNAAAPDVAMQKLMYGPSGMMTALSGIIDPQTYLVTQSVDDAMLQKAIDAAQKKTDIAFTADMKTIAAKLPPSRLAEIYISPENGAATLSKMIEATTGSPLPFELPPGQPPIGVSVSTQNGAIQGDVFLPATLVQDLIGAAMQAYMAQMMNEKKDGGL